MKKTLWAARTTFERAREKFHSGVRAGEKKFISGQALELPLLLLLGEREQCVVDQVLVEHVLLVNLIMWIIQMIILSN
jgi:hypothetical protein